MRQTPSSQIQESFATVRTDLCYGLITLGSSTLWSLSSGWLVYFYLPPGGSPLVPVATYGLVMFVVYIIHASVDLPIGYLSDRTRTRWGRRIPFMFVSVLPTLTFFTLIWTPPTRAESVWNLVYLGIIVLLYRIFSSLLQIPYQALLPELALTDQRRVRMSTWSASFQLIGVILASFAGPAIDALGFLNTMLIFGSVLLPLFYLPLFVLREPNGRPVSTSKRLGFRRDISLTLGNRVFRAFIATRTLVWTTTSLIQAVIPFVVTEVCLLSKSDAVYFYISAVLASLACYPLVNRLSDRVGKWRVFFVSLSASAIVLPGLMFIGQWMPVPLLAQGVVWSASQAMALSGFTVLQSAFVAEITDRDEEVTGQRREGSYYATVRFVDQIVGGAALALLPLLLLLGRSQFDPYGPLGVRIVGVVGGALTFLGLLIFLRYPRGSWSGERSSTLKQVQDYSGSPQPSRFE
jgi:GPH family glycoside/pentoside/hexuronide:cation symporter